MKLLECSRQLFNRSDQNFSRVDKSRLKEKCNIFDTTLLLQSI